MKSLLFLLAFCFVQQAYSQNIPFKVTKSEVFNDKNSKTDITDVLEDGNGGFVLVRPYSGSYFSNKSGYFFEHYNANLKLINDYHYEFNRGEASRSDVIGIQANETEIHIIDFVYSREDKAYICSANTAKFSDFNFTTTELFRVASDEIKNFTFFSFFDSGFSDNSGTQFISNEEGTAFAISVDINDRKQETHKLYLFDNKLNKNIEHTFTRDVKDKKFRYENIEVSNDGQAIYLLGKVFTDEKRKKRKGGRYQYELTRITANDSKTREFDSDDNFVASLKTILIGDKVVCVGFYSEKRDNRYKGVSYFELDPITMDIVKTKYNPFTEQFLIDKYGKSKDKELRHIRFRNIFVTQTGDIVFNGEENYSTTVTTTSANGFTTTRTLYHYNDIVSAKLDNNGDMQWARNINKSQRSSMFNNPFHSYSTTVKGDDTFFFINTKEKVKKLRNDRIQFKQATPKRSNLNVIRVNKNGDFDHQEILNSKESDVAFHVSDGKVMLNNGDILFIGRKGRKKQLIRVSL